MEFIKMENSSKWNTHIKKEHSSKWNTHQNGTLIKMEYSYYQNGILAKNGWRHESDLIVLQLPLVKWNE